MVSVNWSVATADTSGKVSETDTKKVLPVMRSSSNTPWYAVKGISSNRITTYCALRFKKIYPKIPATSSTKLITNNQLAGKANA